MDLVNAKIVCTNLDDDIIIPDEMGQPSEKQMNGTKAENLCELAGRTCYDSLSSPRSRSSEEYHQHIKEVGHLSVYEHFHFTVLAKRIGTDELRQLFNRPSLRIDVIEYDISLQHFSAYITCNLRHVLEWPEDGTLKEGIVYHASKLAPMVVGDTGKKDDSIVLADLENDSWLLPKEYFFRDHVYVSMYISGSRGLSHELVRHGDWTAISQRSTRYVDESEGDWVTHPLIARFLDEANDTEAVDYILENISTTTPPWLNGQTLVQHGRSFYSNLTVILQDWLISRGVNKFTARKQARGAARGYLGNALQTELIFTASIPQWKHILKMRCHPAADAEIREMAAKALVELKDNNNTRNCFIDMDIVKSEDGIGFVLEQ